MDSFIAVIVALVAAAAGAAVVWLVHRSRMAAATTELKSGFESQIAALNERVLARDQQIQGLSSEVASRGKSVSELVEELRTVSSERAAALEKHSIIPQLEQRLQERELQNAVQQAEITTLKTKGAELESTLESERVAVAEKLALLEDAKGRLSDAFKAVSSDALRNNNESFIELANAVLEKFQHGAAGDLDKRQQAIDLLVRPIKESLEKFDTRVQELEKTRIGAYEGLHQQVRSLLETQSQLRTETGNLVRALGSVHMRGRWGEMQLKRVVELAGMLEYCDFYLQQTVNSEEGRLRPDLIVRLVGGKSIVVDAKAPLSAYLEAAESQIESTRKEKLQDHARRIREHMAALSKKSYWEQFQPAPEFVVLFLPGEMFFSAALEHDPALIECGVDQKVILATPTTLIALLKAVAYGWRQEKITVNAKEINDLGRELYKRLGDMAGHFRNVGGSLNRAVESYNQTVASLEGRVLVSARRFHDLAMPGAELEIEVLSPLEKTPRDFQAPELVSPPNGMSPGGLNGSI